VRKQPKITVGIMDREAEVSGCLNGVFLGDGFGLFSGPFTARPAGHTVALIDSSGGKIACLPLIRLKAEKGSTFTLSSVTIGNRFHWERKEDQTFPGDLALRSRGEGTLTAINEIPLEDYLASVIASEMNDAAPPEYLKAHAILSRSWLLASLEKKQSSGKMPAARAGDAADTFIRWYDREDHDLFDVCADDHCQRYQGITRLSSENPRRAVRETEGLCLTFHGDICDARYSKACGGLTEDFGTAWEDRDIPYLKSVPDAPIPHRQIGTEEEAATWFCSRPEAYCNTGDEGLLRRILSPTDRDTEDFFRWTVEYTAGELEEILHEKSGLDLGALQEIIPLRRGPSGRISMLKIVGSKKSVVVGKELEIRRWLSRSHLLSSAFVVRKEGNARGEAVGFVFHGAGWGHGVGLCQIGAAVMAERGFPAADILKHYFRGAGIQKIY
jgi:SpoIID/LytB domain protein